MPASFLNDEFFAALDTSVLPVEDAESLPPLCYTDREFYDFEKEALFNHEWLCIGRESWVQQPGDYFTSDIIGEPLVASSDLTKAERNKLYVRALNAYMTGKGPNPSSRTAFARAQAAAEKSP